jgi:hypothetical protein
MVRYSLVRLLGHEEISRNDLMAFLQKEKAFDCDRAAAALSADRCCLYIENFREKKIALNSEHFLITLIAIFPHNFVARNYLSSGYHQHLTGLRDLLVRNIAKSIPPFEAAKLVIDYFLKNNMLTDNAVNIYILLYNLMICHTNYFLILEDTDVIDSSLMRAFQGAINRHA